MAVKLFSSDEVTELVVKETGADLTQQDIRSIGKTRPGVQVVAGRQVWPEDAVLDFIDELQGEENDEEEDEDEAATGESDPDLDDEDEDEDEESGDEAD